MQTTPATSNPAADAKLRQALRTIDEPASDMLSGEACVIAFHDAALLPLHHEMTVWGAQMGITCAARADQYTLATGVGRTAWAGQRPRRCRRKNRSRSSSRISFVEFRDGFQGFERWNLIAMLCPIFPIGVRGHGARSGCKYMEEAGCKVGTLA